MYPTKEMSAWGINKIKGTCFIDSMILSGIIPNSDGFTVQLLIGESTL
jgi:hypothetical protein